MGWSLFEAEARGEIPPDSTTMLIWNYIGPAFDTTINGIGSTVWALARDPEQWKILKDDPSLVPSAFNEGLRMETRSRSGPGLPGRRRDRRCLDPGGSRMCVLLGSATVTSGTIPIPTTTTCVANPHDTSPSGTASTPASVRRWPAPRPTPCSPPSSTR